MAMTSWLLLAATLALLSPTPAIAQSKGPYNLRFAPDKDRLVGAYYQAVQKQTFDVEFARQK
jgi:hypothetical protein